MHNAFPYPLYLVLSEKDCTHWHWLEVAEQALKGGVDIVQLREKDCPFEEYVLRAKQLKQLTDAYAVPLVINDAVDVAIEVQSWGIHVGRTDMQPSEIAKLPDAPNYIGWSLEALEQLESDELKFVHHLGVSPVFSTPTKMNTITEWGLNGIQQLKVRTSKPLIAIGGIHTHNAKSVLEAGADSLAVVSAICGSQTPFEVVHQLKQIIHDKQQTI